MGVVTEDKIRVKKGMRVLLYVLLFLIVLVAVAQAVFYFGSDRLLRGYVQRQVDEVSGGKYHVEFEEFQISLLERGFYLKGFSLSPVDSTLFEEIHATVYKVEIPEISVKGLGFRFGEKILTVGRIRLKEPMVRFQQPSDGEEEEVEEVTPLRQLELEIQRSFGDNLKDILIREVYIDDADLLLVNFISQKSITADETSLYVRNLQLAQVDQAIPFNAEGFEFDLRNFEMLLADSIHLVSATSVRISSLDKAITVDKVRIIPDRDREAAVYYEIDLDNLELRDADIDQIFYTSDVNIGNLRLVGPHFVLYTDRIVAEGDELNADVNLYDLIQDILSSISIENLNIQSGYFLQRGIEDPNKNRIEAEEIFFHMMQVYIGSDLSRRENQFFYANEAELDISQVRLALADGIHWVTGESVMISSMEDKVSMERIRIMPELASGEDPDIPLFEIEVPFLNFNNANLKKVYNENIVDVEELRITSPRVVFRDLKGKEGGQPASTASIQDLVKEYLRAVYVQNLEITEGRLVMDNHLRVRQDSLSFGNINLLLRNFQLDDNVEADMDNKLFYAEHLRLDIEDYALKLSDNLHLFTADRILIDTESELLDIEGFRLAPFSKEDVPGLLERYGRTTILDMEIPRFTAYGVDITTAYFEEKLNVKHIDIPSPTIKWTRFMQKEEEEAEPGGRVERTDLFNLLSTYFSEVSIDSLTLNQGSFAYDNFVNEAFQSFAENDISVTIKKFYLDEYVDMSESGFLFAEELDIGLNNYVFNIADGRYQVVADRIAFNSAREEISTFNVRLRPQRKLDGKVSISATIPDMSFGGVDLEAFLFENRLELDRLRLVDADVKLSINRTVDDDDDAGPTRRDRSLPKTIDAVQIGEISAQNARLNVSYNEDGKDIDLIKTGISIAFSGFMLDSVKLADGDIAALFRNMALEVDDFSLALKDSVHTVNFSNIELDVDKELIILDNLKITPKRFDTEKGRPVIQATVPRASITTKSLRTFQRTGDLDIALLLLTNPQLYVYLDKDEIAVLKPEEEKEKVRQAILQSFNIASLQIQDGELSIREKSNQEEINGLRNISMMLTELSFDLTKPQQINTQFLLNNDYQFELNDYEIKLPDSLNTVFIEKILLSQDQLIVEGVSLMPRYGRYHYARRVGEQVDVAEVRIERMVFDGLVVNAFIDSQKIVASSMRISNPTAFMFRDKRMPRAEDIFRKMPQQLMREIEAYVEVEEILVENGSVTYEEFPENGMIPGRISFTSMEASLRPFQLSKEQGPRETMRLDATMMLNHAARLNVNLLLGFDDPYPVKVEASVGEFELSEINSILETNAFITVESGLIRGGEWHFTADKNRAIGEMTLRYNDLKVRLLDERTLEVARGRKGVLTFVVNALALRSNNPRKLFNRLVSSNIYHRRDTDKFIFNYMWKATFSGLMGSSGISQPKIPRKEEDE
ncbi:MAG: hypothetical protein JJU34_10515 [Lunatimonas sp.]|uniref:hypothetical protein n=1 Tax=Lunatimonas sp. TaxID=2060141 RepID=UPI00263B2DEB|nr:hypothetical protein [Lunatimonas sp.]MCC5937706.1 hypothetical protein [Lunatimonas sp.]